MALTYSAANEEGQSVVKAAPKVQSVTDNRYFLTTPSVRLQYSVATGCWQRIAAEFDQFAILISTTNLMTFDGVEQEPKDAQTRELTNQQKQVDYQKVALTNNDELAWLGPLPATWSE